MTPTKEQWTYIQDQVFKGVYGRVELLVDGYKIVLQRGLIKESTLATTCYVNGVHKGQWLLVNRETKEWDEEARKFYQLTQRSLYPQKEQKRLVKLFGKRKAKKVFNYDAKHEFRYPYWKSFNSFKRHLLKENKSIELVEVE